MKTFLTLCLSFAVIATATATEIKTPDLGTLKSLTIRSIDDQVKTLGKVEFVIDMGAMQDDLFELKARRSGLKLKDGSEIAVFGYDKELGVLIGAAAPVSQIVISGKENDALLTQFYGEHNELIAPIYNQIQLFDLEFNPLDFDYTPALLPSNVTLDVSLLIDVSGSMEDVLDDVTKTSRRFLSGLPVFTRCSIFTFGTNIERLTHEEPTQRQSCPDSLSVLSNGLSTKGATALHRALQTSLEDNKLLASSLPKLTIVVTDGQDTQNPEITVDMLHALKSDTNSRVLAFWAGSYVSDYLTQLADIEIVSSASVDQDLAKFFNSIGVSINGMQSITIK